MSATYFSLAGGNFFQDWSNTGAINTNDDWSGVASIVGYLGDVSPTGTITNKNATTVTDGNLGAIDVIANQTSYNISNGGVAEFQNGDAVVGLQGSGTADAPSLVLYLDASNRTDVHVEFDLRRLDADPATQQFNVQYRFVDGGTWSNVPGAYVPNAAAGSTHFAFTLPSEANGQGTLQVRFLTVDATGSDAFLGVDNIAVTSNASAGAGITISGGSITEGDDGDKVLTFTVTRSETSGAFTVDYGTQAGSATDGSDYQGASGTLTFAAGGEKTQTISINIHGDTTVEPNEAFTVLLSNLQNTTGAATLVTASATGTILNDDFTLIPIYQIQGAGHTSSFNGQHVVTSGIVTAIDTTGSFGFWIQDAAGDGDSSTSDAVFVFTNSLPTVQIGQTVRVEGNVNEYGGGDPNNLTVTEIDAPTVTVLNGGALSALPAAAIIGEGGRLPPTEVIDNDNFTVFDPAQDAADFYESMEGMRVTVHDAQAVDSTNGNATWIVNDGGDYATGMNSRGGITIGANDLNPERVQIYFDSGVSPAAVKPDAIAGDHLGDVTGVMHYFGGNYELLPTAIGSTGSGGILGRETTALDGDGTHVTVGAYNVENLDPTDPQAKFDQLGIDIAQNLGGPDIVGLEEIQDADGAGNGTNYSGAVTAQKLIDAIVAAGGPHYVYIEIAPTTNNSTGGEGNGNIRQGYLYNPERVSYVDGSIHQILDTTPPGDAYNNSRRPLVADFRFNGETITIVDVHNYSRGGSQEPYGQQQPPLNNGDDRRLDQTSFVKTYVEGLVSSNPGARVVVMGDFNAFQFEPSLTQLESGGALMNLTRLLAPEEQFSYAFEGNMQQIDHLLASPGLQNGAQFDIVHMNSGQPADSRPTDHDGLVARFLVNHGPTAVADSATVFEDGTVTINVLANDNDPDAGDTKTIVSVSATAAGGHVSIVDGKLVYAADADAFDLLGASAVANDSFTYVMRDAAGLTSTATVSVVVKGVGNAPTLSAGNGNGTVSGTDGDEVINGGNGNDLLNGLEGADTLVGGNGGDTAFGGNGIDSIDGGAGADSLDGGEGNDKLTGGTGNDAILGGGGADSLSGAQGNDTLTGGSGADTLSGGLGDDRFVFGVGFGKDVISDFDAGDRIQLDHTLFADFASVMAHAQNVGADVVITYDAANTITLQGVQVAALNSGDFLFV